MKSRRLVGTFIAITSYMHLESMNHEKTIKINVESKFNDEKSVNRRK